MARKYFTLVVLCVLLCGWALAQDSGTARVDGCGVTHADVCITIYVQTPGQAPTAPGPNPGNSISPSDVADGSANYADTTITPNSDLNISGNDVTTTQIGVNPAGYDQMSTMGGQGMTWLLGVISNLGRMWTAGAGGAAFGAAGAPFMGLALAQQGLEPDMSKCKGCQMLAAEPPDKITDEFEWTLARSNAWALRKYGTTFDDLKQWTTGPSDSYFILSNGKFDGMSAGTKGNGWAVYYLHNELKEMDMRVRFLEKTGYKNRGPEEFRNFRELLEVRRNKMEQINEFLDDMDGIGYIYDENVPDVNIH